MEDLSKAADQAHCSCLESHYLGEQTREETEVAERNLELLQAGFAPDLAPIVNEDVDLVAELHLPSDGVLKFWLAPRATHLGILELCPAGSGPPVLLEALDTPLLDIYYGLTAETDPVPKRLFEAGVRLRESSEDKPKPLEELFGKRSLSSPPEGETEVVEVDDLILAQPGDQVQHAKTKFDFSPWNCATQGATSFQHVACGQSVGKKMIASCLPHASYVHISQTGKNKIRKKSTSIGVFCQTHWGLLYHQYRSAGKWRNVVAEAIPSNQLVVCRFEGDGWWRRAVIHRTTAISGYARQAAYFFN